MHNYTGHEIFYNSPLRGDLPGRETFLNSLDCSAKRDFTVFPLVLHYLQAWKETATALLSKNVELAFNFRLLKIFRETVK